jgi:protein subunit release factor B
MLIGVKAMRARGHNNSKARTLLNLKIIFRQLDIIQQKKEKKEKRGFLKNSRLGPQFREFFFQPMIRCDSKRTTLCSHFVTETFSSFIVQVP